MTSTIDSISQALYQVSERPVQRASLNDVSIEVISPDLARQYLDTNQGNRNPRFRKVDAYARDMSCRNWVYNGETIKFDTDGRLIDGQQRLMAVEKSGVAVAFLVVRNLRRDTQSYMDVGSARTFGDALKMSGYINCVDKAAITGLLRRYEVSGFSSNSSPSIAELFDTFHQNAWIEDDATIWSRIARSTPLSASIAGVTWGILSRVDETSNKDAEFFFDKLGTDVGQIDGDPILALRRKLHNEERPINHATVKIWMALVFKAWNKFRSGEQVDVLYYRAGGASPEAFPVPR